MKVWFKSFVEGWDFPSGSILGFMTLVTIGMGIHAYAVKRELPLTFVDLYKFSVGAFAGSKSIRTIWGKAQPEKPTHGV